MALVDEKEKIFREKVEQTIGLLSCLTTVKIARIVLYSAAMTKFFYHLHVVFHTFLNSLSLNIVAYFVKEVNLFEKVVLNLTDGGGCLLFRRDKDVGWIQLIIVERSQMMIVGAVEFFYIFNLVVPPCHTQNVLAIGH